MTHERKKIIYWTSSKLEEPIKRREDKLQTGRKYLQSTYITKEHHPGYKKNSQKSTGKKAGQLENGQKT